MRRTLRDAGLAAAVLLARSAIGASVTLVEGLPANLAIDGDLGEWIAPPSLILGAPEKVAGPAKPSSTADLASPDGPELTDDGKPFWIAARLPAALWTFRGGGALAGMASRGDTLHMLVATEGTFSRLGTGTCDACPAHAISVLAIDTSRRITELLSDWIGESVGEDDGQGGTVETPT